jgi:hypothetical protein
MMMGEDTLQENEDGEGSYIDEEGWDEILLEDEDEEPVTQMDTDLD